MLADIAQAILALVPSESPHRRQEWLAHDAVVVADHRVWGVRIYHHVNVGDTTSCNLPKLSDTGGYNIFNDPVLCMCLLDENSHPFVRRVRPHKEWMSTVSLATWGNTNIVGRWVVIVPHRVDTVSIEESTLRTLTQTHNSLIIKVLVS
jgi:hypothetical protein